jgi:transposase-like protein
MAKRTKRTFTSEFKADAVRLCQAGDRSITQVAKDLDLTESALRVWVARAKVEVSPSPTDVLTSAEREELQPLRRDVKRLQMERDLLKKATTFFVKESA